MNEREKRLARYRDWIRRREASDSREFHVDPMSWEEALRWCLEEIQRLEQAS